MVKSTKAVDLMYVTDNKPGLTRKRHGKIFFYYDGTQKIKDKVQVQRIKKLGIPPAWENVWICKLANGHLKATGFDLLKPRFCS